MPRSVAFLRAINVGRRLVKMEVLRRHFEEMGFAKVATLIASGNVIFETRVTNAAPLEGKIERHLLAALGFEVTTFLRSADEMAEIAGYDAFPAREAAGAVYVAFLKREPSREIAAKMTGHEGTVDSLIVRGREIHWLCRTRFSDSDFSGARLEKLLGQPATVRNMTTVRKLAAMVGSG